MKKGQIELSELEISQYIFN